MDKKIPGSGDNLFPALLQKYLPYWPLFILLILIGLVGAWSYLKFYAIPTYQVSASLIMKDEKKGVNDSRMTESIDAFTSNKIVENEINVIHSYALMRKVVNKLRLYAPVYEEKRFKDISAYTSSPIQIKVKDTDNVKEFEKVYFTYLKGQKKVKIGKNIYPLNKWVKTPYGEIQFSKNKNKTIDPEGPLFFSIIQPRKATDQLLKQVLIEASSKLSTVINLTIQDPIPQRGEDILNTLINVYNQLAIDERNELAANTLKFVENRIKLVENELEDLESEVVKFKSTEGAVDLSEQSRLYLQNVGDNDRKIAEINTKLAILANVERYVISKDKASGIVPSTLGIDDPVLSQLLQKLYDSEIQYQKLKLTTADNNPVMSSIADEIQKIRPSILENIRHQRINLQASRANLVSTNNVYNSELQTIPQKEKELLGISRQQSIKNDAYSFLLQKREETVLSYAPSAGDFRVVDMAESSVAPTSPNSTYIYLIAVAIASVLGIAFVTSKEFLSDKVLFRSEIEAYTNAPIVAELAYVKPKKGNQVFKAPEEASVIEQFRQLRATMGLYGRTFVKHKIVVTSNIPGEGKSYVSTNLSFSLASSGKKVALLDFDLRNPKTTQLFSLLTNEGITEYLVGDIKPEDIIVPTAYENLVVIPCGLKVGDYTEVLLNGKIESLFTYLEKTFDYIIIDTPPLELVSDGYLLSEFSDITLLVMRHAHTPRSIVQRLSQNNKLKSLNNVAIIFNGIKPRGFGKGKYGYGYGYGYDQKYGNKTYAKRSITANA